MKLTGLLTTMTLLLLLGAGNAFAGGDAAAGEAKAANCGGCHGADGMGMGDNPKLAGLDEAFFVKQMNGYKSGDIESPMMQMFAGQLSDEDIADLAAYYASLASE